MSSDKKPVPNAHKHAARAYANEHGVKYTEALRAVALTSSEASEPVLPSMAWNGAQWEDVLLERYGGRKSRPEFARYLDFARRAIDHQEFTVPADEWTADRGVGDGRGLYQGHTIVTDPNGSSHPELPVFYDLQNVTEYGGPPVEVVTGFPGSGKAVTRGLKCAHEDCLRGVTQVVWDPAGGFVPLKQWAKQMRLDPTKVKLVDICDPDNLVSLDAFALAEVDPERNIDESAATAIDVLWSLCRGFVRADQERPDLREVLVQAVQVVVTEAAEQRTPPTMQAVLAVLRRWWEGDFSGTPVTAPEQSAWAGVAGMLHDHLASVRSTVLGGLLFRDPRSVEPVSVVPGDLVIFIARKMRTSAPDKKPTVATTTADVVSGLMVEFMWSTISGIPDEEPKSVILDEWHVIKRTQRAEARVDWMRRVGRSKRCMVRQMSQSATGFTQSRYFTKGSLSTVWCGYAQNHEEAVASCQLLGIEPSDTNTALLQNLKHGQFLFKDALGRVAHVQVDIWDTWLLEKFRTRAKTEFDVMSPQPAAPLQEVTWYVNVTPSPRLARHELLQPDDGDQWVAIRGCTDEASARAAATRVFGADNWGTVARLDRQWGDEAVIGYLHALTGHFVRRTRP